jgi:hypothetical protein
VLPPTAETFTALARSSPWRWSTLRFTARGLPDAGFPPVRAWLRRPDRLRVETLDGELRQIVREAGPAVTVLTPAGGYRLDPSPDAPLLRADGLVERRPGDRWAYDAPMYQNYRWVALLDPLELADGIDRDTGATVPALVVDDVREVEHGGRPAWEAVVRTTPAYEPRCGCCALLRSREVDLVEYRDYPDHVLTVYPEAHRVRLDVATGVCVAAEEIGGLTPGHGHDVRIEAVDEPMADDLFVEPPRGPFRRRGWAQYPGPT